MTKCISADLGTCLYVRSYLDVTILINLDISEKLIQNIFLQVATDSDKHFFTSFAARDKTYMMLFKLWQNALLEQVPFWKFIYVIFRKTISSI